MYRVRAILTAVLAFAGLLVVPGASAGDSCEAVNVYAGADGAEYINMTSLSNDCATVNPGKGRLLVDAPNYKVSVRFDARPPDAGPPTGALWFEATRPAVWCSKVQLVFEPDESSDHWQSAPVARPADCAVARLEARIDNVTTHYYYGAFRYGCGNWPGPPPGLCYL